MQYPLVKLQLKLGMDSSLHSEFYMFTIDISIVKCLSAASCEMLSRYKIYQPSSVLRFGYCMEQKLQDRNTIIQ